MSHDVVVKISSITQLQDQVQFGLRVDYLVEADHVGVLNQFHAADLLKEMSSRNLVQFRLVYHLDCHFLTGKHVPRQLDDGKVTTTCRKHFDSKLLVSRICSI